MIKVGLDLIVDKKTKKERRFTYYDVQYEPGKWADASKYLPADFDLVYIKSSNHIKTLNGWSIGKKWDGIKIDPDEKVLYWKKNA